MEVEYCLASFILIFSLFFFFCRFSFLCPFLFFLQPGEHRFLYLNQTTRLIQRRREEMGKLEFFSLSHASFLHISQVDEVEGAPKLTQQSKEVESQSVNRTSSRSLVGHSGPVYSCDFSPDCRYLLSCSQDGSGSFPLSSLLRILFAWVRRFSVRMFLFIYLFVLLFRFLFSLPCIPLYFFLWQFDCGMSSQVNASVLTTDMLDPYGV